MKKQWKEIWSAFRYVCRMAGFDEAVEYIFGWYGASWAIRCVYAYTAWDSLEDKLYAS